MRSVRNEDVLVFDDARSLARGVADRVVELANAALRERASFTLALAGGTTPKAAYELLSGPDTRAAVDWSRVRFFFGDERCVPPENDDSNYKMARQSLLGPLGVEASAIFRMHGESEPGGAARAYADVLRRELGSKPRLDLIMLGMGPDGHTASLFPGSDPFLEAAALVRAPWVEKMATHRLTITPHVINNARHVIVSTEGSAKADALAAVLEGPYRPADFPIQSVAPTDGRLLWHIDLLAAAKLRETALRRPPA